MRSTGFAGKRWGSAPRSAMCAVFSFVLACAMVPTVPLQAYADDAFSADSSATVQEAPATGAPGAADAVSTAVAAVDTRADEGDAAKADPAVADTGAAAPAPADGAVSAVWDGTFDVSWYNTTDTAFTVTTPAQLAGLASIVNGTAQAADGTAIARDTFAGKTVRLGEDVTLNATAAAGPNGTMRNWTPIGTINTDQGTSSTTEVYFDGTFDGQGHAVRNIYIDGNVSAAGNFGGYQGFFGALGAQAQVMNLGIDGGYLYGRVVGGVAAVSHVANATEVPHIIGCYNTATVAGNGSSTRGTGGIFGGENRSGSHEQTSTSGYRAAAYIANCYNAGTVNGPNGGPAGGIAGVGSIKMYACYNVGQVNSQSSYQGALVGNLYAQGYQTDIAPAGTVKNSYALEGTAANLYRTLDATHDKDTASTDYDRETSDFLSQFSMTGSGAASRFSQSFVDGGSGAYPLLYWQAGKGVQNIAEANAAVSSIPAQHYTGQALTPAVTVTIPAEDPWSNDTVLHEGSDYTVAYADNVNVGTGSATVTGLGRYSGSLQPVSFQIIDATIASIDAIPAQWFYGEAVEPAVTVRTASGDRLVEGSDYTLSYANNDRAGTGTVTVTAVGEGAAGSMSATFQIVAASSSLEGAGTVDDPYLLASKADLQYVAHQINALNNAGLANASYKLTADIDATSSDATFATDLANDPWCMGSSWSLPGFGGTIDGDGHAITLGLSEASLSADVKGGTGLALIMKTSGSSWGTATGDVIIKNLTLKGSVDSPAAAAAFICSATCATLTFENCVNDASVKAGDQYGVNAAGFVASTGSRTKLAMTDCRNKGNVSSGTSAAGFVQTMSGPSNTFAGCVNAGSITGAKGNVGGIVAEYQPSSGYGKSEGSFTMTGCSNSGAVQSLGTGAAGGLLGYDQNKAPQACVVATSFNTGRISSGNENGNAYVGGLVGQVYNTTLTLLNVYNTGTVARTDETAGGMHMGGIVGVYSCDSPGAGTLTVQNAYNAGLVDYNGTDIPSGALLGHAFFRSNVVLKNCYYDSFTASSDVGLKAAAQGFLAAATVSGTGVGMGAETMKSPAFVDLLGAAFDRDTEKTNNGFPVLSNRQVSDIADCVITDIPEQAFKGTAPTPSLVVSSPDGKRLVEGVDYAVFYTIDAGTGTATVYGTGSWTGVQSVDFAIAKCEISDCLTSDLPIYNYADNAGGTFAPVVKVTSPDGTALMQGADYTVAYVRNDRAGVAMVLVRGIGAYYQGTAMRLFTIEKGDLSTCTLSGVADTYAYTRWGANVSATITAPNGFKLDGNWSRPDTTMTFYNAAGEAVPRTKMPAGEYDVVWTGTADGNWTGELRHHITYGKNLATDATVGGIEPSYRYTGQAIALSPTVVENSTGAALSPDGDYTVAVTDAAGHAVNEVSDPGSYQVTVSATGTGAWFGSVTVPFSVVPDGFYLADDDVTGVDASYTATGAPVNPKPKVVVDGKTLTEGIDYTVAYEDDRGNAVQDPTDAGSYVVVVSGIGNYAGVVAKKFSIVDPVAVRLAGEDALGTMKAIVNEGRFPKGGTVVLATLDGYWDALAASGIAGLAKAPVLMTSGDGLSTETAAQLGALEPSTIIVVGGTASVSNEAADEAAAAAGSAKIVRCAGQNAAGTAADVYAKGVEITGAPWSDTAFVCSGSGYWDALSAAPVAYAKGMPIFLTSGVGSLDSATLTAMKDGGVKNVYLVGGERSVDPAVAQAIEDAGMVVAGRLAGSDAIATSEAVASYGLTVGMSANRMGMATNSSYYDALAGAALCGKNNAVMVLVGDESSSSISGFVTEHAASISTGYLFGGTGTLSTAVEDAFKAAVTR